MKLEILFAICKNWSFKQNFDSLAISLCIHLKIMSIYKYTLSKCTIFIYTFHSQRTVI